MANLEDILTQPLQVEPLKQKAFKTPAVVTERLAREKTNENQAKLADMLARLQTLNK